jgi:methionyl-tRNA formyltransferase
LKILFVGTVEFSARLFEKLVAIGAPIAGVVTKKTSPFNADHVDLSSLAGQHHIPSFYVEDVNNPDFLDRVKALKADVCYCFGFSQLLSNQFLGLFAKGAVGYHPAALPSNRGRHPIIWTLALGLKETASTFFFLNEAPDAGDIISQVMVPVSYEDDAQTLYDKLALTAADQVEEVYLSGLKGTVKGRPQVLSEGNSWRKRLNEDGKIDFRMGSRTVYNLVRALTRPYVGAHLCYQGQEIKVWKVREEASSEKNIEPGKILGVDGNHILVKCYEGAVRIIDWEQGAHCSSIKPKKMIWCGSSSHPCTARIIHLRPLKKEMRRSRP